MPVCIPEDLLPASQVFAFSSPPRCPRGRYGAFGIPPNCATAPRYCVCVRTSNISVLRLHAFPGRHLVVSVWVLTRYTAHCPRQRRLAPSTRSVTSTGTGAVLWSLQPACMHASTLYLSCLAADHSAPSPSPRPSHVIPATVALQSASTPDHHHRRLTARSVRPFVSYRDWVPAGTTRMRTRGTVLVHWHGTFFGSGGRGTASRGFSRTCKSTWGLETAYGRRMGGYLPELEPTLRALCPVPVNPAAHHPPVAGNT